MLKVYTKRFLQTALRALGVDEFTDSKFYARLPEGELPARTVTKTRKLPMTLTGLNSGVFIHLDHTPDPNRRITGYRLSEKGKDGSGLDRLFTAISDGTTDLIAREIYAGASFQERVKPWLIACFGPAIAADCTERNHRFLEEALELVQACDCTQDEAHQLVDYVYGRPVGERPQEVGGVMVTLAALCLAQKMDMHTAGETELARVWTKIEKIRSKQAAKPKHSPLPGASIA